MRCKFCKHSRHSDEDYLFCSNTQRLIETYIETAQEGIVLVERDESPDCFDSEPLESASFYNDGRRGAMYP